MLVHVHPPSQAAVGRSARREPRLWPIVDEILWRQVSLPCRPSLPSHQDFAPSRAERVRERLITLPTGEHERRVCLRDGLLLLALVLVLHPVDKELLVQNQALLLLVLRVVHELLILTAVGR